MFFKPNLPAFAWTLVIFILCATPGKAIPHIDWLELLSFDKWVHASIFFILQLLYTRGFLLQEKFPLLKNYAALISMVLCVSYGGLLEIMQYYVFSQRSGDWLDFIANSFGVIMGTIFFRKLCGRIPFLLKQRQSA